MEFITMSFAEIIALQNVIDKDEDIVEEAKVSKKTRKNHFFNKGERAQMKKEKRLERAAIAFKHCEARIEGENITVDNLKGQRETLINQDITWFGKKVDHDVYHKLCKAEKVRDAEKRLARFEDSSVEEENFSIIKNRYYAAMEDLADAEEAVIEAEEKHEELNAEVDWLQYAPATGWTIEQAHNIYMETLKEREDFIPIIRRARLEYSKALYAYNEAKAAYDMLPFWA